MANTRQAEKRARQAKKRELHNASQRSALRTAVKKVLKVFQTKEREPAATAFRQTAALLDKAATKRIIHKNNAARLKSRLHAKLKRLAD